MLLHVRAYVCTYKRDKWDNETCARSTCFLWQALLLIYLTLPRHPKVAATPVAGTHLPLCRDLNGNGGFDGMRNMRRIKSLLPQIGADFRNLGRGLLARALASRDPILFAAVRMRARAPRSILTVFRGARRAADKGFLLKF